MRIGLQTWGSEGDIRPFIALAAGLVAAGHEVCLVVTDDAGRDYTRWARRYGFGLKALKGPGAAASPQSEAIRQEIISVGNPLRQAEMIMTYGFDPVMEDMYTEARNLCAGNDLVIGHFFVFPLRVAAEKARVPIATVNIVHNCVPSRFTCPPGIPDFGRWFYPFGWKVVRKLVNRIFLRRVNALRVREGLEPKRDVMDEVWAAERLNLVAVSPRICERPPDWSSRHQICGFLNPPSDGSPEELPAGLEDFLASGPAPVYMTFGSMMAHSLKPLQETHSLWVEAAKRAKCRAVLQIPWSDLSVFERNPGVFTVERSPYLRVFPRCAGVVHHGGAGTTQASLVSGKPSIVVAHMADQTFWGSELKRLGVGARTLTRNSLTPAKLAREITRVVTSPAMSDRAGVIGRQMAEEDGVRLAVQLIEGAFPPTGATDESEAARRASIHTR